MYLRKKKVCTFISFIEVKKIGCPLPLSQIYLFFRNFMIFIYSPSKKLFVLHGGPPRKFFWFYTWVRDLP